MKVLATTLNTHGDKIHPLAQIVVERLCQICPEAFQKVDSFADCDAVVTNAPSAPPYEFDKKTEGLIQKPIIIFNDADGYMPDCDHDGFGAFVRASDKIKLYFYREWWKGYENQFPFQMVPLDLTQDRPTYELQDYDQFRLRPFEVFWSQSIHTLSRKSLWERRSELPAGVFNNNYKISFTQKEFFDLQDDSKITIALEGGGIKCRSHCEACVNSVMAMPALDMVEAYPWIDGVNCIRLPYKFGGEGSWLKPDGRGIIDVDASLFKLRTMLSNADALYNIYCAGVANAENYRLPNYYRNHIAANILKYI
jgi:hypothetical protein